MCGGSGGGKGGGGGGGISETGIFQAVKAEYGPKGVDVMSKIDTSTGENFMRLQKGYSRLDWKREGITVSGAGDAGMPKKFKESQAVEAFTRFEKLARL